MGTRPLHGKGEKDQIAAWKEDLNRILHVFNVCIFTLPRLTFTDRLSQTELAINTQTLATDNRNAVGGQEGGNSRHQSGSEAHISTMGR